MGCPYQRPSIPSCLVTKKARDYILKNSGTHFDPQVIETFLTDFADLVKA
jgi:response regulator RpfG family c-di-GMP phosphodiesterase